MNVHENLFKVVVAVFRTGTSRLSDEDSSTGRGWLSIYLFSLMS